jgi:hypothetical protein
MPPPTEHAPGVQTAGGPGTGDVFITPTWFAEESAVNRKPWL